MILAVQIDCQTVDICHSWDYLMWEVDRQLKMQNWQSFAVIATKNWTTNYYCHYFTLQQHLMEHQTNLIVH